LHSDAFIKEIDAGDNGVSEHKGFCIRSTAPFRKGSRE
jgi:hypothetical protein